MLFSERFRRDRGTLYVKQAFIGHYWEQTMDDQNKGKERRWKRNKSKATEPHMKNKASYSKTLICMSFTQQIGRESWEMIAKEEVEGKMSMEGMWGLPSSEVCDCFLEGGRKSVGDEGYKWDKGKRERAEDVGCFMDDTWHLATNCCWAFSVLASDWLPADIKRPSLGRLHTGQKQETFGHSHLCWEQIKFHTPLNWCSTFP